MDRSKLPEATRHLLYQVDDIEVRDQQTVLANIMDALSWYLDTELGEGGAAMSAKRLSNSIERTSSAASALEWLLDEVGATTARDVAEEYSKMESRIGTLEEELERRNGT